jgi:hypothetical protein
MHDVLKEILRPIVRFCIRHSIKLQEISTALKELYVECARDDVAASGSRPSDSRIAAMTGVHRKDIARLQTEPAAESRKMDVVQRVIGQWRHDPRFSSSNGKPRTLKCEGTSSEFASLVSSISSDLNPYTVLNELMRTKSVTRTARGAKLVVGVYMPRNDVKLGFSVLGSDIEALTTAVEENLLEEQRVKNLHIRTEFDKIPVSAMPQIRHWLLQEGTAFHAKVRNFLAQHDLDMNPKDKKEGSPTCRAVVGAFSKVIQNPKRTSDE